MNLIYVRKVGYGVRNTEEIKALTEERSSICQAAQQPEFNLENRKMLQRILETVIEELKDQ
jgi:hypothetical protein